MDLAKALTSKNAAQITAAAKTIAAEETRGHDDALRAAFHALAGERAGTIDPGGFAKEAVLTALDRLDDGDATLFATATTYEQWERARGKMVETGARVRARGILGLARLGHPDFLVLAGACLGDREPSLRLAAAQAVGHRGERSGAGLLLLRLNAGDEIAEVWCECLRGLFALAPQIAATRARSLLRGDDRTRERALQALGSTPDDAAVEVLTTELAARALPDDRGEVIGALALSVRPKARLALLDLVSGERASDAEAALRGLAIHRYDTRLVDALRERTALSRELSTQFRALFERD